MISSAGTPTGTAPAPGRFRGRFDRVRLRALARPAALSVCTFLLGFVRWFHIPSPFALALLAAVKEKPSPMMLLGMGASLGFRFLWGIDPDLWQYAGFAMLWLIRQKCRPHTLAETAALAGIAAMPRVIAALIDGAALPILYSCAALPFAMLFGVALQSGLAVMEQSSAGLRRVERFCAFLLVLLLIGGLGYFRIFVLNLGQMAAVWMTVVFAAVNGPVYGVTGGLMCALSMVLSGHSEALVLMLSLCGLLCGLPDTTRLKWMCIPAVLGADVLGMAAGFSTMPPMNWWTAGAGALLVLVIPPAGMERLKKRMHMRDLGDRSMENAFISHRITRMRQAIENLARALPECEGEALAPAEELRAMLCAQCTKRELCWGRSRMRTEQLLTDVLEASSNGAQMDESTLIPLVEYGCLRLQETPALAHSVLMKRRQKNASAQKAHYERELMLTHLAALSDTLGALGRLSAGEGFHDLRAAHAIRHAMEKLGIPARLCYARRVDGHLMAALEAQGGVPAEKQIAELLNVLAAEEDMLLAVSAAQRGRVELEEIPLYSATVGTAFQCAAEGSHGVCGDSFSVKRCEGGRLLMMLCDGMGHGEKAHQQSEKAIELLQLLLEAGYTRRQAITAVNGILLSAQAEERFTTVDMADVDLWSGEVALEKLGACASWMIRGNHLKKMEGASLPLGIVEEIVPTASRERLHSGDILIMMSDGVADAFATEEALRKTLMENVFIQPQRMADQLLRSAMAHGAGADDMSVMVLLMMDRQRSGRT